MLDVQFYVNILALIVVRIITTISKNPGSLSKFVKTSGDGKLNKKTGTVAG